MKSKDFNNGAMFELEAHHQFLKRRLKYWASRKEPFAAPDHRRLITAWSQMVFDELASHVRRLEKRRRLYPPMKEPKRITRLRTKHA